MLQNFSKVAVDLTVLLSAGRQYHGEAQSPASNVNSLVKWGPQLLSVSHIGGRRYNSSTRDHTHPYRRAADTVVPTSLVTSY